MVRALCAVSISPRRVASSPADATSSISQTSRPGAARVGRRRRTAGTIEPGVLVVVLVAPRVGVDGVGGIAARGDRGPHEDVGVLAAGEELGGAAVLVRAREDVVEMSSKFAVEGSGRRAKGANASVRARDEEMPGSKAARRVLFESNRKK